MVKNNKQTKLVKSKNKSFGKYIKNSKETIINQSKEIYTLYIKKLKETNSSILKNIKLFYAAILIDVFFFLIYGFVNESFVILIQLQLDTLRTVAMTAKGFEIGSANELGAILFNEQTLPYMLNVIIISTLSVISTYFLFCFFIGISNGIRTNLNKFNRNKLIEYLKSFYKNMIAWFIIYIIFNIITLYISLINTIRPIVNMSPTNFGIILQFIGIILMYFFITSYSNNVKKGAFRQTFRNASKLAKRNIFIFLIGLMFIFLIVLLLVAIKMLSGLFQAIISLVILNIIISYILVYYHNLQVDN